MMVNQIKNKLSIYKNIIASFPCKDFYILSCLSTVCGGICEYYSAKEIF